MLKKFPRKVRKSTIPPKYITPSQREAAEERSSQIMERLIATEKAIRREYGLTV